MMAEYIERDWLYEQVNSAGQEFDIVDALEMIENFPAADVVPVRRGHWIKYDDWEMCSECGGGHEWIGSGAAYCDECGAEMEVDNG